MRSVFFISDRTGITTEALGNALLTQFGNVELRKELIPFVDTELKANQAIIKVNNRYQQEGVRPIVITSIIDPNLRHKFDLDYVFHMDFFEAFIPALEAEIGQEASRVIGKSHGISDEAKYYKRIDAIDFSLVNDDGVTDKNFSEADVILIGVSRVGKTPTCLYLAINYGIKAANYPLAEIDLKHDNLPKILKPYHNKLFGLTIEVERLHHIRVNRIPGSHYADLKNCRFEIEAAESIMQHYDIPYLNSSHKSIEEISVAIMQSINLHRKF
jgi:regulator of PEP synthase PpsR (kinase-PPPase family)